MTTPLFSPQSLGLLRVASISPELRVADVAFNVRATVAAMDAARAKGCSLALFPELGITGYTCGDLFRQATLLHAAREALVTLAAESGKLNIAAVVGLPLEVSGRLFNCAALVSEGRVVGIVPKTYLPNYSEFYELRHFARSINATTSEVEIGGALVPFGADMIFAANALPGCVLGIEICEDLWAVEPPSGRYATAGATVLLNPSASPGQLGKAAYRRDLIRQQSARCLAAYLYAGAGPGESTTDVVYDSHSLIFENGVLLGETERFSFDTRMTIADVDMQRLAHERLLNITYAMAGEASAIRTIPFDLPLTHLHGQLLRPLTQTPFVPANYAERAEHCREIFAIQSTGLAKRLLHTGAKKVTIGISGGLDSTLALLVAARAFDKLGLPRGGIVAITMPGFGTTDRTYNNALTLMRALGVSAREIPIGAAVGHHFEDIDHDPNILDVTYENAQARERTQILMDMANQVGGFVVGTGDLSEAALGWMTFNGDHMSMYHVNIGVPKTLVRYLIEWSADEVFTGEAAVVLRDISATPISPELLPLKGGQLQQKTEETVGPYVLHDFFLFQHVRYGFSPRKVFFLAQHAFSQAKHLERPGSRTAEPGSRESDGHEVNGAESRDAVYDDATILKWLAVFYSRFFSQQFKRNAMPDGPKVGSVALSPRGDWRMPSDASSALWKAEVEAIKSHLDASSSAHAVADAHLQKG